MSHDDSDAGEGLRERLPALPGWLRTAAVGLVAGVSGGFVATMVDPGSTLATLALILLVVAAVTALAARLG